MEWASERKWLCECWLSVVLSQCRHDGAVWQVAWAHPKFGNILASCSYDRKVSQHVYRSFGNKQAGHVHDSACTMTHLCLKTGTHNGVVVHFPIYFVEIVSLYSSAWLDAL